MENVNSRIQEEVRELRELISMQQEVIRGMQLVFRKHQQAIESLLPKEGEKVQWPQTVN